MDILWSNRDILDNREILISWFIIFLYYLKNKNLEGQNNGYG